MIGDDSTCRPTGAWRAHPHRSTMSFAVELSPSATLVGRFEGCEAELELSDRGTGSLSARLPSPKLWFASTAITVLGDRVELDGELMLGERTRLVTGCGTFRQLEPELVGLSVATWVDRRQFGVLWDGEPTMGRLPIPHEAEIRADLVLRRDARSTRPPRPLTTPML